MFQVSFSVVSELRGSKFVLSHFNSQGPLSCTRASTVPAHCPTFAAERRPAAPLLLAERIEYQLRSLTYKVLTTTQPSYLHNLITVERRCCWAPAPAAVDQYVLPAGRSAANPPHVAAAVERRDRQTGGWTDGSLHIDPAPHTAWAVLIRGGSVAEWLACWTRA